MNGIFSDGGGSSGSSAPSPQVLGHPKSPSGFQSSIPAALPSPSVLWIVHKKKSSEGPKTFGERSLGASSTGPGLLAARKSLSAEELKGLLLRPRLERRQRLRAAAPAFAPVPLGPSTSAAPGQNLVTPRPAWHRKQFPGAPAQELGPQHLERSGQSFLLRLESPS